MKRLESKIAVIYGNGTIGETIAQAFTREGAKVFLTGRNRQRLSEIADGITASGGSIQTAVVDASDEAAVARHLDGIGRVDIVFNAIGKSQKGIQGLPIAELAVEDFMLPIVTYARAHFVTASAAARRMVKQGSGVIMAHTPNASRISPPFVGGAVPAWAAIEALFRSLSVECGAFGVRSVCLHTTGIPETKLIDEVWEIHGKAHGITFEQFHNVMEGMTHRKRLTTLRELSDAAVFAASDEGSAITGTILNLTAGMIVY